MKEFRLFDHTLPLNLVDLSNDIWVIAAANFTVDNLGMDIISLALHVVSDLCLGYLSLHFNKTTHAHAHSAVFIKEQSFPRYTQKEYFFPPIYECEVPL